MHSVHAGDQKRANVRLADVTANNHALSTRSLLDAVPPGPSSTIPSPTHALLNARFGWDLSHIRIHSDAAASRMARQFQADAYTVGNHVVLGSREPTPELLAHEVAHAVQQSKWLGDWRKQPLRVSKPADIAEREATAFTRAQSRSLSVAAPCVARKPTGTSKDKKAVQLVLDHKAFLMRQQALIDKASSPGKSEKKWMIKALVKGLVPKIRGLARAGKLPAGQTEEHYYGKIEEILDKPKVESVPSEGKDKSKVQTPTAPTFADPTGRMQLEGEAVYGADENNAEEQLTASLAKGELEGEKVKVRKVKRALIWGKPRGLATIFFYNRASQKGNFLRAHIHLRVHLEPKAKTGPEGKMDKAVVEDIKAIVQEIETAASGGQAERRVTLDLEVLDKATKLVTTLQVDASEWPTSSNPWGPASTMVEELFHGLGLDDSYDYIEGHAGNVRKTQQDRLELFDVQLRRFAGQKPRYQPDLPSITKWRTSKPTDWDYCQVLAQQPHELAACRRERGIDEEPP